MDKSRFSADRTELHPLKPFLPVHARLLMLGSFPPPRERWTMNFYYPNFQNDMWRIFGLVFFADRDCFVAADGKSFDETAIRQFLTQKGIALFDTAEEVVRQKGNASDQFLTVVKLVDLINVLSQIPRCETIATTGQKATETLMQLLDIEQTPPVGGFIETQYLNRTLRCYRMPSTSRAYPKPLTDKATAYSRLFATLN